jgi:hypothetical protein
MAAAIAGGCADRGEDADAGLGRSGQTLAVVCTRVPDVWRIACDSPRAGIGEACSRFRHHEAIDSEDAALRANVRLCHELSGYHFGHGARAAEPDRPVTRTRYPAKIAWVV